MQQTLAQYLLKFKESDGFQQLSLGAGELDLPNMSASQQQAQLYEWMDLVQEDVAVLVCGSVEFETACSFIKHLSHLAREDLAVKLVDMLVSVLQVQTKALHQLVASADRLNVQENEKQTQLKQSVEALVFLLYGFTYAAERQFTSKTAQLSATSSATGRKGNAKKGTAAKRSGNTETWNWATDKLCILETLQNLLSLNLTRAWPSLNERAPFVTMFVDLANLMLETEENLKSAPLRSCVFHLLALAASKYDQAHAIQTIVLQNIRYSTFLAEPMADFVALVATEYQNECFGDGVLREMGQSDFSGNDKASKEFGKFLVWLSVVVPKLTLRNISVLLLHLDSESYTVRCAMIEVLGNALSFLLDADDSNEQTRQKSVHLCMALEERMYDISSYCRSKVLKTFGSLCGGDMEEASSQKRGNAVPLIRRQNVIDLIIGRLQDKASLVRKDACRALVAFLASHPFWLDGGLLDVDMLQSKRKEIEVRLESLLGPNMDLAQDAMSQEDMPALVMAKPGEIEDLLKRKAYYEDACRFTASLNDAVPMFCSLLDSKVKSDVIEAIHFFVQAEQYKLVCASVGIATMLHLIWSKDVSDNESKSIRETVLHAYCKLYIEAAEGSEKEQAKMIVRNLVTLTFYRTLADLISLEQLLGLLMSRGLVSEDVIRHLWVVFGTSKQEIPIEQRRGAILVLGMLAQGDRNLLRDRTNLMVKVGLSHINTDLLLAQYTCIALQKMVPISSGKGASKQVAFDRFERNHVLFQRTARLLLESPKGSMHWFSFAEQALNMVFALADQPALICGEVIRSLSAKVLGREGDTASFELARLIFVVGHVAIKEIVHLEAVEADIKSRKETLQAKDGGKENASAGGVEDMVGSVEDHIGETMLEHRERTLLFGTTSMFAMFVPLIRAICMGTIPSDGLLLRMSVLTLSKFMCVSERFCEDNLVLLLSTLRNSVDAGTKCNIIIAIGDMVVCFNNLIEQNVSYLYNCLDDGDLCVKKNALMVLTHLILNGMVKVKGQIGLMARCIDDSNRQISDMAKLFFTELSQKDNAVYNNLPDIISSLSQDGAVEETSFRNVVRFLFSFISKERQTENIVEKLCMRFKNEYVERKWRDVAYCLSQLPFDAEKTFKKIVEWLPLYQDKILEPFVFKCFMDIIGKAKKAQKMELQVVEEFERSLVALHAGDSSHLVKIATSQGDEEEEGMTKQLQKVKIRGKKVAPGTRSARAAASTKRRRQNRVVANDTSEESDVDMSEQDENAEPNAAVAGRV